MKCGDVKRELALHLGHDSDNPAVLDEVRSHVANCVECRVHYRRLKDSMNALDQSDTPETYEVRGSLWPAVEKRLDEPRVPRNDEPGLRSWFPMISVAAACLLFVIVWAGEPGRPDSVRGPVLDQQMMPMSWGREPGEQGLRKSAEARQADKRAEEAKRRREANL